jgi:hypothetical protein
MSRRAMAKPTVGNFLLHTPGTPAGRGRRHARGLPRTKSVANVH